MQRNNLTPATTADELVLAPRDRSRLSFIQSTASLFKSLITFHSLIWALFRRDLLMTYRRSFLGNIWLFLSPLIGVISWVFFYYSGVLKPGDLAVSYPAFVLSGTMLWGLFIGIFTSISSLVSSMGGLITQIRFPKEVLVFKIVLEQLAYFSIALVINSILFLVFGTRPGLQLLLLPIAILPLIFWALAIGLVNSIFTIVAHDLAKLMTVAVGLVFFASPVVYNSESARESIRKLLRWNPLTEPIEAGRWCLLNSRPPNFADWGISLFVGCVFFLLAWRIFYLAEDKLNERVG